MNERPPCASIVIDEGVDRLELRMRDSGLDNRRRAVVVAELAEVLEQFAHVLRRRGGTNVAEHGL